MGNFFSQIDDIRMYVHFLLGRLGRGGGGPIRQDGCDVGTDHELHLHELFVGELSG